MTQSYGQSEAPRKLTLRLLNWPKMFGTQSVYSGLATGVFFQRTELAGMREKL